MNTTEARAITCINMGVWHKMSWGSMKKAQRLAVLLSLTARGFLDDKCRPTELGIITAHRVSMGEKVANNA